MAPPATMEASLDRYWLLGEPGWWNLGKEMPPDFRPGELAPPETWVSSTPRIGNLGWIRQRLRPLAWPLLRPMAWAPTFLVATAIPLAFSGRTPNDQAIALALFALTWVLIVMPLILARNVQPTSSGTTLSLPVDWMSLGLGAALFPLHLLVDPRLGWASYAMFWIAYIRTVFMVQETMKTPPARFLLPIDTEDWSGEMSESWEVLSEIWARREIARAPCGNGNLVVSGVSRGEDDFLALTLVHKSGFVLDPFHESLDGDYKLAELLTMPLVINGKQWPNRFVLSSEEE